MKTNDEKIFRGKRSNERKSKRRRDIAEFREARDAEKQKRENREIFEANFGIIFGCFSSLCT